jgi:hypothetical protein
MNNAKLPPDDLSGSFSADSQPPAPKDRRKSRADRGKPAFSPVSRKTPKRTRRPVRKAPAPQAPTAARSTPAPGAQMGSLELLAKVRSGEVKADILGKDERQPLVIWLVVEGLTTAEIAHTLRVRDRTIERDRQDIREANAVAADPKLTAIVVGQLLAQAELSTQRIRRIARDRDVPPGVKIDAEFRCYQIASDYLKRLQSLGYLLGASAIQHGGNDDALTDLPELTDLHEELQRLAELNSSLATPAPEVGEALTASAKARIATKLKQVRKDIKAVSDGVPEIVAESRSRSKPVSRTSDPSASTTSLSDRF